ncbi:MAG: hypothetical protein ABR913_07955 [Sedimentisphaerales bacterium]|jgi:hypothetical protein
MNKPQKRILANFVVVLLVTATAVVGMVELKNMVNRSESMRAMESLGRMVSDYKQKNGSIPPESQVDEIIKSLEGQFRLGDIRYRAQWIAFDSPPDTILAYAIENSRSLFSHPGAIVLRFDGRIEWMDKASFDRLIAGQQTQMELEMTSK